MGQPDTFLCLPPLQHGQGLKNRSGNLEYTGCYGRGYRYVYYELFDTGEEMIITLALYSHYIKHEKVFKPDQANISA